MRVSCIRLPVSECGVFKTYSTHNWWLRRRERVLALSRMPRTLKDACCSFIHYRSVGSYGFWRTVSFYWTRVLSKPLPVRRLNCFVLSRHRWLQTVWVSRLVGTVSHINLHFSTKWRPAYIDNRHYTRRLTWKPWLHIEPHKRSWIKSINDYPCKKDAVAENWAKN